MVNKYLKAPVEYIYNTRKNEKGLVEIVFVSKGQTFLKHLKLDERLPDVSSVSWFKSNHDYTSLSTNDGSLLRAENIMVFAANIKQFFGYMLCNIPKLKIRSQ